MATTKYIVLYKIQQLEPLEILDVCVQPGPCQGSHRWWSSRLERQSRLWDLDDCSSAAQRQTRHCSTCTMWSHRVTLNRSQHCTILSHCVILNTAPCGYTALLFTALTTIRRPTGLALNGISTLLQISKLQRCFADKTTSMVTLQQQ